MICPIKTVGISEEWAEKEYIGIKCVEDQCAWWVFYSREHDDGYECAIASIARKQ